jgi:hypothetical protein
VISREGGFGCLFEPYPKLCGPNSNDIPYRNIPSFLPCPQLAWCLEEEVILVNSGVWGHVSRKARNWTRYDSYCALVRFTCLADLSAVPKNSGTTGKTGQTARLSSSAVDIPSSQCLFKEHCYGGAEHGISQHGSSSAMRIQWAERDS